MTDTTTQAPAQDANGITSGYMTPDGKSFRTKAEAVDYLRKPLINKALNALTDNNAELVAFLLDSEDAIQDAFAVGVKRVTKSERAALKKALDHVVATLANDHKAKFVVDNAAEILETFKWPNQTRVKPEDKDQVILDSLNELTNNPEVSAWIVASKDALDAAWNAGVVKREVSQKTLDALQAARIKRQADFEAARTAEAKAKK